MKRRIISFCMCVVMCVMLLPVTGWAENGAAAVSAFQQKALSSWVKPVQAKYLSVKDGREFGASRDNGGRNHAAIDYYVNNGANTPVFAMQSGTVIEYSSNFYGGTQAVAVQHADGSVARYCEIYTDLRKGNYVTQGQTIGKMKANTINGGTMLHLELYLGTATGGLTQSGNTSYDYVVARKYNRRRDLLDPTFLLSLSNSAPIPEHTHDKGTFLWFEAAHPHRNTYKCSICGETWVDYDSSNYYGSCEICNPPTPSTYTLRKDYGDGIIIAETYNTGTVVTLPSDLKMDGYVFDGWYTEKTGGTKITSITVYSDVTVYAHWSAVTPEYIFDLNGLLGDIPLGNIDGYGICDVYINGSLVAGGVTDYYAAWPAGTTYEIKNIRTSDGYSYDGISTTVYDDNAAGGRTGTITQNTSVRLAFHPCPTGIDETPKEGIFNGHTYYYFKTPVTWYDAKSICEHMGGHLATVSNAEENQFIFDLSNNNSLVWLGATDVESEGHWQWITGEPFDYQFWSSNQPDNCGGSADVENYLQIWSSDGSWNDNYGCAKYPFVCEVDSASCDLDLNGWLDSTQAWNINGYGTADIYINGQLVADDVSDYCTRWPAGTTYEIRDIRPLEGYAYDGIMTGDEFVYENYTKRERTGTITENTSVNLTFRKALTSLPETPKEGTFNGHTYYYFSTPVTWYDAKSICEHMGGHMATVSSMEENQFIFDFADHSPAWLGATDTASEGNWQWITGEPFSYTFWSNNQPDNWSGSTDVENYMQMYTTGDGSWNDASGCELHPFVCEIDTAELTVTLDPNRGTVSAASIKVNYGGTYGGLLTPARTGYTFDGWYTAASGGTKVTASTKVSATSNHTLYAHWTRDFIQGNVNGSGGADVKDMACLFDYLSTSKISGAYKNDAAYFKAVADVNEDGTVNILDYQALYELVKQ